MDPYRYQNITDAYQKITDPYQNITDPDKNITDPEYWSQESICICVGGLPEDGISRNWLLLVTAEW